MFGKLNEIPKRLEKAQERIKALEVEVRSPDGLVYVRINGLRQVQELTLGPEAQQKDPAQLAQVIQETINDATDTLHMQIQQILEEELGDVLPNLPGMDLKKLISPFNPN